MVNTRATPETGVAESSSQVTGDATMRSQMMEIIEAPVLKTVARKNIIHFFKQKILYERRIEEQRNNTGDQMITAASLTSMIDQELLEYLIKYKIPESTPTITCKNVTVAAVETALVSIRDDPKNIPNGKALMEKVQMDLSEKDVMARVAKYFRKCDQIIEENALKAIFDGKGKKRLIDYLVAGIRPISLREIVENDLKKDTNADSRKDERKLYKLVETHALYQDRYFPHWESRIKRPATNARTDGERGGKKSKPGDSWERASKKETDVKEAVVKEHRHFTKNPSKKSVKCFHCQGAHFLRECKVSTDEEKRIALEKYRVLRNAKKINQ